ncbi:hypothetical protein RYX36_019267 [Vicia faba]
MALASCALAFDPSPLQDFCVAINDTNNGDVLTKAFQVDNKIVDNLQKQFWYDNN